MNQRHSPEPHAQELVGPDASRPKPRSTLKTLGIVAAVVLPLITAAGIAIPLIANLNERESSVGTLNVFGAPDPLGDAEVIGEVSTEDGSYDPYRTHWRLPVTAPIETLPLDQVPGEQGFVVGCSDEQLAWLETHAVAEGLVRTSYDLKLHNSASTGGSLALGNVRFLGEEVESEPTVLFSCPPPQIGDVPSGQPLLIAVDGSEALYGEPLHLQGEEPMPVGSPASINLSPGEVRILKLARAETVDRTRSYEGRIVADAIDGSGETVVLAEGIRFDRDYLEGFEIDSRSMETVNGQTVFNTFTCVSPELPKQKNATGYMVPQSCTLAEAAAILREAAAASEN